MYSNKENINILTALLIEHGVRHAVVCPGSRNAPIVHNLDVCPQIECFPVTDERSAGFYALGIAQYTNQPTVVCVTSGTALLNVLPAVAEAYYQHVPIIIISADRPLAWIDQQDGQTLPQADALGKFVKKAVSLPEPHDAAEHWLCNRLVNEVLITCKKGGGTPVHINVPISEPLFDFSTESLPTERVFRLDEGTEAMECYQSLEREFLNSQRPMIVIGQMDRFNAFYLEDCLNRLRDHITVIYESLSFAPALHIDKVLGIVEQEEDYSPDAILYVEGTLVSKKLKQFLRRATTAKTWTVSRSGDIYDTFQNLYRVIEGRTGYILDNIAAAIERKQKFEDGLPNHEFHTKWQKAFAKVANETKLLNPKYSQVAVVKEFCKQLSGADSYHLHAANSMSVRLVDMFTETYVSCNRGVNGIEGSLSTAAGFSLIATLPTYCVIGDLSFFYDSNALWNQNLHGNFRILLLNNGCGGIFNKFSGLQNSPAKKPLVMASHRTSAKGLCQSYGIEYRAIHNLEELNGTAMQEWMTSDFDRPSLLEVFTDAETDTHEFAKYV
ncbi:2-succinyl-5-enolpyruvyl-6-hydroxy-3-cyclohexene-1-carboxylic-acid synthase [Prevotella sp. S7 MS 2]|uniref:2-succinyl-5-enolpyruvyl-6-hydroxy-3- cyclohexene-1-carboxylic-acid synthase n=1 Tax=Prevotella sp. S7 MS 2 TaxID=1287488 RepID=UPI0005141106|nr:2-succinyl-5-enolpyruvyl-6-hydroxy-3-cyclohexene-1-carboxylic-acid synthase [Prevotella sp. S7 MS 2]KGI60751.1 2-succinyl-5-enolpyruvyl-6-hydroxy-3-cyclohexene-1-carboxylate synthase [Prevotella sp. S7 MS 2]